MKEKIRVSGDIFFLVERRALVHCLGCKKTSRGVAFLIGVSDGEGEERDLRAEGERVPMWYFDIISLAVSLWMAMNSSVASWPAAPVILVAPPG